MASVRPFALVRTQDQWLRAAHEDTFVDARSGAVELAWSRPPAGDAAKDAPTAGGLAFDAACRLYRSVPDAGRVERSLWSALDPLAGSAEVPRPLDLFEMEPPVLGDFRPAAPRGGPLREPRGVAVDGSDRLFVAEAGAGRVLVHDLWSRRLLRRISLDGAPLDLAAHARGVLAVAAPGALYRLGARDAPERLELPAGLDAPSRVAASPCGARVAVLDRAGTADARVWVLGGAVGAGAGAGLVAAGAPLATPGAGDLEFLDGEALVVARGPGDALLRFHLAKGAWTEVPPLTARGYDGMGIVRTPDGRIGFWTAGGFRFAVAARVRYTREGRVTTFRLDGGAYQTVWGRVFVEACVPEGTEVVVHCATADEPPEEAALARTPPGNVAAAVIHRPDLSPPMPPVSLVAPADAAWQALHRRESGRELPWALPAGGDPFRTYEAPVIAPPGRFLWVTLRLRGTTVRSPRVRSLRIEHPAHDHLRRLPRTLSRDPEAGAFLHRYMAMPDGLLMDLDSRAAERHALLDPRSAPEELLPWLAAFPGLPVDDRWPADALRRLIAEAVWLFRFRGTVPGLRRFLEIYLGVPVALIEHFRMRGMGGAMLGEAGEPASRAVLGAGFRVGGALGAPEEAPLGGGGVEDAFDTHAHRFTVVIPGSPSTEQLDVVRHIVEVHRPAHTVFELCTAGAGMRVGRGLHVGLSSVIGRTGGFATLQLDGSVLGQGAVLGRPEAGARAGASRLGEDTRVG